MGGLGLANLFSSLLLTTVASGSGCSPFEFSLSTSLSSRSGTLEEDSGRVAATSSFSSTLLDLVCRSDFLTGVVGVLGTVGSNDCLFPVDTARFGRTFMFEGPLEFPSSEAVGLAFEGVPTLLFEGTSLSSLLSSNVASSDSA